MPRTRIPSKIWFPCKFTPTKLWSFLIIRLNIWCKSLANLRNRIWKQPPSSSGEIESTFWKDRTLYYNVVVLRSQNHIKHDTLYSVDWIIFLIKGLFEPKYHTWIQLNVRAKPKTKLSSKKIVSSANSHQRSCYYFSDFVWTFNVNVWVSPQTTFENK